MDPFAAQIQNLAQKFGHPLILGDGLKSKERGLSQTWLTPGRAEGGLLISMESIFGWSQGAPDHPLAALRILRIFQINFKLKIRGLSSIWAQNHRLEKPWSLRRLSSFQPDKGMSSTEGTTSQKVAPFDGSHPGPPVGPTSL